MKKGPDYILRSTTLTVLGSSLLWAWGYLCYLSPAMFPLASIQTSIGIENAFFVSQMVAAIFASFVFVIASRKQVVFRSSYFLWAAIAVSVSGVLIEAALYGLLPAIYLYLAAVLDGIGIPLMGVAWGTRYCLGTPKRTKTAPLVLLSFLVAYLLYLIVLMLPTGVGAAIICLIPVASWFIWYLDARIRHALTSNVLPAVQPLEEGGFPGEVTAGDRDYSILPWRAISIITFAGFIANFVSSYIMGWGYQTAPIVSGGVFTVAIITLMAYAISLLEQGRVSVGGVYRFTLPFTVLGLLIILVFGQQQILIGGSLINGCGMFMQILIIIKVAENTKETGVSPLLSFSVGQGIVAFVVFVGNVLGKILFSTIGFDSGMLDFLSAAGILVLFFMTLYMMNSSSGDEEAKASSEQRDVVLADADRGSAKPLDERIGGRVEEGQDDSASITEAALARLVKAKGLTVREAEVLAWLAKGRSLPYIAEQLYVTTGTVKTHTMHIYRKLDLNNKQDLLDLVERERNSI
ncbi:MAG: helix-turn-helix transcriptional regulator [Actinobacteria bacterium]|nr:helix-turn-helix transcriptional regulator [Actinomycetota bacterium]